MEQTFILLTMFYGFCYAVWGEDDCRSNEKLFSIGKIYNNQFHAIFYVDVYIIYLKYVSHSMGYNYLYL